MSKNKNYLQALIEIYLEEISINEKIYIDNNILDILLSDNKLSHELEIIADKINNISEELLPPLTLQYKVANILAGKTNTIKFELLDRPLDSSDKFIINSITGLEPIGGIYWNSEIQCLEGSAKTDGTFKLEIKGTFEATKGYKQNTVSSCLLTVIPDPKSLWKTIEPDKNIPYPKDHEDSMSTEASDGSRLLYASKRGRSHAHVGTFRDDDGKILAAESGWSILAIADGGGSYPLSRRGSKIAVDKSIQALEKILSGVTGTELETIFFKNKELDTEESKRSLDSKLKETILSAAYTGFKGITSEAINNNTNIKDYSTTLLIAAHKQTEHGRLILTFWVGDGVIALYTKGKEVVLLGEPDSGDFAGQTRFLDESFFYDTNRIKIQLVDDFTALILATDGVSDPFFETDDALKNIDKWDDFWNMISDYTTNKNIESARLELLEWLNFWSKGNHDDRSIALLMPTYQEDSAEILDDNSNEKLRDKLEDEISINTSEKKETSIDEQVDLVEVECNQDIQKNILNVESKSKHQDNTLDKVKKLEPDIDTKENNVELKGNNNG